MVGGVEVSTDSGATWHPASGRESWSYAWNVPSAGGTTKLFSRAVDDSGNLETPGPGVAVTITGASSSTFGSPTVGTVLDTADSNYLDGSRFVTGPSGGNVASMSVYVGSVHAAPNNQFQVAIYTDIGGQPNSLVTRSSAGTLTANAWNTLPVTATLSPSTAFWLMYNTNGRSSSVNDMRMDSGAANQGAYSTASVAGTWPTSFGPAALDNQVYSIYVTGS